MSDLLSDVEAFLAKTGMAPTAFGVGALRDRHFVRQLRKGRRTFRETEDKVRSFMVAHAAGDNEAEPSSSPCTDGEIIGSAASLRPTEGGAGISRSVNTRSCAAGGLR